MNYKLEKFWNLKQLGRYKSSELMNYKLEKFWNRMIYPLSIYFLSMNYKLEKFWNKIKKYGDTVANKWTINLKSFEIIHSWFYQIFQ